MISPTTPDTPPCPAEGLKGAVPLFIGSLGRANWVCLERWLTVSNFQRAASTASGPSADPTAARLNIAAIASTAVAAGSVAWYYHLYGAEVSATSPAEEG